MKKLHYVIIPLIVIAILALGIHILAPTMAQNIAFNSFPADQQTAIRNEYQAWITQPIHLPQAALEATPFTTQTLAAVGHFYEIWEQDRVQVGNLTQLFQNTVSQTDVTSATLQEHSALLKAFAAVVERPDYELSALAGPFQLKPGTSSPLQAATDIYAFMQIKKLLRHKAQTDAAARRWPEAFQTVELLAHATRTHPYAMLSIQLYSRNGREQAIDLWTDLVGQCDDANLLRRALNVQNELAGQMQYFGDPGIPLMNLGHIIILREYKRQGIVLDYQDKTGCEVHALTLEAYARESEAMSRTYLKDNPALAAELQKKSASYHQNARTDAKKSSLKLPFIYKSIRPDYSGLRSQAQACGKKLDQLRLQTARKLYRLENGREPAGDAELSPRYLPSPLAAKVTTDKQ